MIVESTFKAPWWLKNAHLQTIWSSAFRKPSQIQTRHEQFELSDGDFLDLEWLDLESHDLESVQQHKLLSDSPLLVLLHGLEGSIDSTYIQGMLEVSIKEQWQAVVLHFRTCGRDLNRLPRSYHSGETGDLIEVLNNLKARNPTVPIYVAGFSLGGNVLLKYLGEAGETSIVDAAVAVSVPFCLAACSKRLDSGISKIYRSYLISALKKKTEKKLSKINEVLSIDETIIKNIKTFYQFDDLITAPLHGFSGADDYYQKSSSRQYLKSIKTKTLIIHAKDDPFMTGEVIPEEHELPEYVIFELSEQGGHVGFVEGDTPWTASYYLDRRLREWILAKQAEYKRNNG